MVVLCTYAQREAVSPHSATNFRIHASILFISFLSLLQTEPNNYNYFFNSIHLGPNVTTAAVMDIRYTPRRDNTEVFGILVVAAKLTSEELCQASPIMFRSFYSA